MVRKSRKREDIQYCEYSENHCYQVGFYLRLSDKDRKNGSSESIENQYTLLMDFIKGKSEFQFVSTFIDDGKTGTNFKRNGFLQMMEEIKNGKINCIIVKDLSRFGRNYLESGYYIEYIFPFLNVRFISVTDNFDTLTATPSQLSYLIPLKNLMNENYARDISNKERSTKKILREKGCFLGTHAIYGYEKTADKHMIHIDHEAAVYVKVIFNLGEQGISDSAIAKYLNQHQIACPSKYKYEKGILQNKKYVSTAGWYPQTVARILTNRIYIGDMVQGSRINKEIKGKREVVPQSEWDIVSGTHKAIISKEQFERVQKIRRDRYKHYKEITVKISVQVDESKYDGILKGKIYCGDCKKAMTRKYVKSCKDNYRYICEIYERNGQCSRKFLPEQDIYELLNCLLKRQIEMVYGGNEWVEKKQQKKVCELSCLEKRLRENKERQEELIRQKASFYQQWKEGMINQEEYFSRKSRCEQDIFRCEEEKAQLMDNCQKYKISNITRYSVCGMEDEIEENFLQSIHLSKNLVECLIKRIEIYEGCRIKVYFKFIDWINLYEKR